MRSTDASIPKCAPRAGEPFRRTLDAGGAPGPSYQRMTAHGAGRRRSAWPFEHLLCSVRLQQGGYPLAMLGLPTIVGEGVVLRALRPTDARALLAVFGDHRVTRMMAIRTLEDESGAVSLIHEIQSLARAGTLLQWGVVLPATDEPIGTVTLASIDRNNRRAELGVGLAHAYWGQGLATKAARTLLGHAFRTMLLHRLEADVDATNGAALRLLENLGFEREGVLRERWLVEGEWRDSVWLGLLAGQWSARRR